MLDRIKAVKNHLLLTLEEVKEVQAAQLKLDQLTAEAVLAANRSILLQLDSIIHSLEAIERSRAIKDLEEKVDRSLDQFGPLDQKVDQLLDQIALSTSRHDLVMMHVQPLNQKADQLRNEVEALYHWLHQIDVKLEQQVESQKQLRQELRPHKENFSGSSLRQRYLLDNPEVSLLMALRSVLPTNVAIDIGANQGDVSELLLASGYEVFAFEPLPEVCHKLATRLGSNSQFHALSLGVGATNEQRDMFTVSVDKDFENMFESDLSVYAGLVQHSLPQGMHYSQSISVPVKNLQTLHAEGLLPNDAAVLKIDTEGHDLAVIAGIGDARYSVIACEFWDGKHFFSQEQFGLLKPIVSALRAKGYAWHIVIYRVYDGISSSEPRFFCNFDDSVENSWGNVLFFRDFEVFKTAHSWCQSSLKETQLFG